MLPAYEAKMVTAFNGRANSIRFNPANAKRGQQAIPATEQDLLDPTFLPIPYQWGPESEVSRRERPRREWYLGVKRVTSPTNHRTVIAATVPRCALSYTLYRTHVDQPSTHLAILAGLLNSFALDYIARQKFSQTSITIGDLKEIALPPPASFESEEPPGTNLVSFVASRVLELVYTGWDMAPFAKDLGDVGPAGQAGAPFVWDYDRRSWLWAELDALYFHMYGIGRDDAAYILDTFPIVHRNDEARYGECRTKKRILQVFEPVAQSIETGHAYESVLVPPPGHGPRHPKSEESS
jgi:hypothetical protein